MFYSLLASVMLFPAAQFTPAYGAKVTTAVRIFSEKSCNIVAENQASPEHLQQDVFAPLSEATNGYLTQAFAGMKFNMPKNREEAAKGVQGETVSKTLDDIFEEQDIDEKHLMAAANIVTVLQTAYVDAYKAAYDKKPNVREFTIDINKPKEGISVATENIKYLCTKFSRLGIEDIFPGVTSTSSLPE
jgi:hypothetical protein